MSKQSTQSQQSSKQERAERKPAAQSGVTVKDVAAELGTDPKGLRAFMRSELGLSAGRGKSYSWSSLKHPQVKRIIKEYSAAE